MQPPFFLSVIPCTILSIFRNGMMNKASEAIVENDAYAVRKIAERTKSV